VAEGGFERILESCIVRTKNIPMRLSAMASRESSSPGRSIVIGFYPTSQVVDAEARPRQDPTSVCGAIEREAAERCWVKLEEIVTLNGAAYGQMMAR
jgi:hypothetical protein